MALTEITIWCIYSALFLSALFSPTCGILAYLIVYLTFNPEVWWANNLASTLLRPSFMAMIFLCLGCLFHFKSFNWNISRREMELYLFLVITWTVTLFFGIRQGDDTWLYLDKITKIFVFLFLLFRIIYTFSQFRIVLWGLVFGGLILTYQAYTAGGYFKGRLDDVGGTDFREANSFASFLAMLVIFLGIELLQSPVWKKALLAIAIAAMLNVIIMTQSRSVFLGLAAAAPFAILMSPKRKRLIFFSYVLLGAMLFLSLSDTKFFNRINTIKSESQGYYVDQNRELTRWDFWQTSLHIFADHPLGIGVKNFQKLAPQYDPRNPGMDAHSTYVLCYTELGILGILLFLVIIAEAINQLKRIKQRARDMLGDIAIEYQSIALLLTIIVYALGLMATHSILYSQMLWLLLSLPICLENAAIQKQKDAESHALL